MAEPTPIRVFEYLDYREYLRAYYEHKKDHQYGFSYRSFSRQAGLGSPNYLKLVAEGERNLTPEMAERFAAACGLAGDEAAYFKDLVAFNQARTSAERDRAHERLGRFAEYRQMQKLDAAQAAYHGRWYLPAIRELVAHADFDEDPQWIAGVLMPPITPAEAEEAVATLLEMGLLGRGEDGRLRQTDPLVTTGEGPLPKHVARYHRAMLERASEAIDMFPRDQRQVASVTLCVSEDDLQEILERAQSFRHELLQRFPTSATPTRLVQVGLQVFPLSRAMEGG